jgi:hypothetical protein
MAGGKLRATGVLAPFGQRGFRFQWPADLATSWAFEMETIILGWYVLTETGSVTWLAIFGSLLLIGTLLSPMFGVMGDRVGHRRVLSAMRAWYAALAAVLTLCAMAGLLSPGLVCGVALLSGLVRPSDMGMRNALIAASMPAPLLMGAMGVERMSADSARVIGALTGAGLVAFLGIGPAYMAVTAIYLCAFALTLQVDEPPTRAAQGVAMKTPWADLGDGIAYARATPPVLAALLLACLANFAAYPLSGGLLPHVARDVYGLDRTGLGYLSASFAGGAMLGSLFISARGGGLPPARTMLAAALSWFLLLLVFARLTDPVLGGAVLALAGFVQSFCMVPLAVLLLRITLQDFRGRVMGLRMLAVYGLPVGLMLAGPLVGEIGFADAGALYAGFGALCTMAIALFWRAHLLPREVPANGLRSQ